MARFCAAALLTLAVAGVPATSVYADSGIKYWLPVDVAIVNATATTQTTIDVKVVKYSALNSKLTNIACSGMSPDSDCLVIATNAKTKRDVSVAISTVADLTAGSRTLDLVKSRAADINLVVEVTAGGILQSVAPTSVGRGSEIVQAIAQIAGTFAGVALGREFRTLPLVSIPQLGGGGPPNTMCNPFNAPIVAQPLRMRGLLASSAEACGLFYAIRDTETLLKDRTTKRTSLEDQLASAGPKDQPDIIRMLNEARKQVADYTTQLQGQTTMLSARLDAFVSENELGQSTDVRKYTCALPLDEIPESLTELTPSAGWLDCYKNSGVALTHRAAKTAAAAAPVSAVASPSKSKAEVLVAFRQSSPWTFEVRTPATNADPMNPATDKLKLDAVQLADVIPPSTPESTLALEAKAFGNRKLTITFDTKGRPTKIEQADTSSAASLASHQERKGRIRSDTRQDGGHSKISTRIGAWRSDNPDWATPETEGTARRKAGGS